ncbi:MAG: primosomal protein N' [Bacteroidia bacterium]|nr:MAG: primosomal protein N' [Bacteroidia bacterium]
MSPTLADIALPVPVDRLFTYRIPPELAPLISLGKRALVPFGAKILTGVVVGFPASTAIKTLKAIRDIPDDVPTFSDELLKMTRWIAEYYGVPWGEVLKAATPQGFAYESRRRISLRVPADEALGVLKRAPKLQQIIRCLSGGPQSISALRKSLKAAGIHSELRGLERRGLIRIDEQIPEPTARAKTETVVRLVPGYEDILDSLPRALTVKQKNVLESVAASGGEARATELLHRAGAALSVLKSLAGKGLLELTKREVIRRGEEGEGGAARHIELNRDQRSALDAVLGTVESGTFATFLLHGVTGSGKTEVYIEAIRHILTRGKTAIVLVPEISLTPQTVRRFRLHFGDRVAVMHSQMSIGERFDAWRMARDGRVSIVIGPRSAVFAPLANLGLIVVDEEHEASYKQFDPAPRYNARDVAVYRGSLANAVVLLGSATPSVESYYNAERGKYRLLELPERVDQAQLPRIEIVDMTKERREVLSGIRKQLREQGGEWPKHMPLSSISRVLEQQIALRLQKNEGVILLQNRRGFSHVVECFECGHVERCKNCEVTLTYHSIKKHLRCHYCGAVTKAPTTCPSCGGVDLRYHAFGTQQVHEELRQKFPEARILRMDLDTTTKKGSHSKILEQFGSRQADILLGTQMVAKGLDFPHVTLVGVISADTQMLLPDFRSAERTFQLLTQVAGRAGRSNLAGEVVIQTLQAGHYALNYVLTHDYKSFYREELAYRKELEYPPFSRIVLVEFSGKNEREVQLAAQKFSQILREHGVEKTSRLLGPADAAIPKVRNRYRKFLLLKNSKASDPGARHVHQILARARDMVQSELKRNKVLITVDIDPQGVM